MTDRVGALQLWGGGGKTNKVKKKTTQNYATSKRKQTSSSERKIKKKRLQGFNHKLDQLLSLDEKLKGAMETTIVTVLRTTNNGCHHVFRPQH